MCDINNEFEYKFKEEPTPIINECNRQDNFIERLNVVFRWTSNNRLFDNRLNFSNAIRYFSYFNLPVHIRLWDVKGFDIFNYNDLTFQNSTLSTIQLSNSRLDIYNSNRKISSCQEMIDLNQTRISISQIPIFYFLKDNGRILIDDLQQNEANICPLLFRNKKINRLTFMNMIDTFYKSNILSFSNETFPMLNSKILRLDLAKVRNINLDLNLVHPSVFNTTSMMGILGESFISFNSEVFKRLNKLRFIEINPKVFRMINRKQGIEWIRQMNRDLNVSLRNISSADNLVPVEICFMAENQPEYLISRLFPDEDFCIYVNYPFNQFVIAYKYELKQELITCTYFWLAQYCEYYNNYLNNMHTIKSNYIVLYLYRLLNLSDFKSISKCKFEKK